jgi:predicted Zn-dependent peptidase
MSEKEILSTLLGEKYDIINHASGLKIIVYPKQGYKSCYAVFGTRYGSIDNSFRLAGEPSFSNVPAGIAHFLEHKLFENENEDAFARFAKTGASANAYTSFDRTCYLFSCTENFDQNLEILLSFVRSPYFTEETVTKEQGIIGQEIKMYDDQPSWRVFFNLLGALYHTHPVNIDIAGTADTISKITPELLYHCYKTFYRPNNMVLVCVGNITKEQVLKVCGKITEKDMLPVPERHFEPEPEGIAKTYITQKLSVSIPVCALGFKEEVESGKSVPLKEKIITEILLDMLFSRSGELYQQLLDKELINSSFGYEYFTGPGFASVFFQTESKNPKGFKDEMLKYLKHVQKNGLDPKDFKRSHKKLYGRQIMGYNDVDELANELVEKFFEGCDLFDDIEIFRELTFEDTVQAFERKFDLNKCALSVIEN